MPEDSVIGNIFRWFDPSLRPPITDDVAQINDHNERSGSKDGDAELEWASIAKWLHAHARDILDESDEILHSRFQLVYTIGLKQHMDGYPDRWTITQHVLRLVKDRVHTISRSYPRSIEYECGPPGSFPHVRIVRASEVGPRLISLIVEDIMAGRFLDFNFQRMSPELRDAIRSFISDGNVLQIPDSAKKVEEYAMRFNRNYLWNGLLLLRGLLASNILLFALTERRWRVDYGLIPRSKPRVFFDWVNYGPTPTMLAVPYRAKDLPAPNTQFGHPDITIILTCLSYYYSGLDEKQLRVSFEILLDQDDPSTEYALWIEDHEAIPDSLRRLNGINLRSSEQWDDTIFPLFTRNQAAINFYLSRVVFPQEATEFPWKLSMSSWDLAEKREKLMTGE